MGGKSKLNRWDLVTFISFLHRKGSQKKAKRQPIDWEEIFTNDATDKGQISQIYKQLI